MRQLDLPGGGLPPAMPPAMPMAPNQQYPLQPSHPLPPQAAAYVATAPPAGSMIFQDPNTKCLVTSF